MALRRCFDRLRVGRRRHASHRGEHGRLGRIEPLEPRTVFSSSDGNGPVLTAITSTPGSRSLVLSFDGPLLASTATDLANYSITAPSGRNPALVTASGPALKLVAADYGAESSTSSQVTLTLARPLRQGTFYRIFINGELPITSGNPGSNPLKGGGGSGNTSDGVVFDGDNDDTAGGNFFGLFAVGRRLTFADSSGDRVAVAADGAGLNVWRELNGDIDQITVLPGATALSGSVVVGKDSTGTVPVGSVTIPVPAPLVLNGAANGLPSAFVTVPPGGLPVPPPMPTATSPTPVVATSANLPFTLSIAPVSAPGMSLLPGIQSGVYAQVAPSAAYPSGLWLVFGGRTNGLHDFFPPVGEQTFPPSFQNSVIYVINPVDWQVWSRPWSQTGVTASISSPLSSTNQSFYQRGDTLYAAGGYSVPDTVAFTGTVTALSREITVTSGLENLVVGRTVSGVLPFPSGESIFAPGTTITAIDGDTVTVSQAAVVSATGVALAAFNKTFTTYDTLTALSIKGLAQAVISGGDVARLARIRQMSDPRLAVTGGDMAALNGRTYLVFGHNFQGGYNGASASISQVYTDEIRSFRLSDNGRSLAISDYRALRDPVNYRRRDGNLVSYIGRSGEPQLAFLGGVFTPGSSGVGYQAPVLIGREGRVRIDAAYQQFFSQYNVANIPLHDGRTRSMYDVRMGGISLYSYSDGQLTENTSLPWIDDVTTIMRAGNGSYQEYIMSPLPAVTPGSTGNYGATAAFFMNQSLPTSTNRVIALNRLRGPTVVGYMYGGIYSTVAETTGNTFRATGASNQVFQITLTPT